MMNHQLVLDNWIVRYKCGCVIEIKGFKITYQSLEEDGSLICPYHNEPRLPGPEGLTQILNRENLTEAGKKFLDQFEKEFEEAKNERRKRSD